MKEYEEMSIVDEMNKEAEEIRKRIEADESLSSVEVTPEMDARMNERIRKLEERLEQESAQEENKKLHKFPRKKKLILALAAVLILLFAIGMTSVGSKSYLKRMWDSVVLNQEMEVTSVADMDSSAIKTDDESMTYRKIAEAFGTDPVSLRYTPYDVVINSYILDEKQRLARVFYTYGKEVLRYSIYGNDTDSSYSRKSEDQLIDTFLVNNGEQEIQVEEYKVTGKKEHRYVANFEFKGIRYQLFGIIEREKFEEILNNLKYF